MEKEIFIKKVIHEDDELEFRREKRHYIKHRGTGNGFGRSDKGIGNHLNGGRRDGHGPHYEEGCNIEGKKHVNFKRNRFNQILKTKLFTSKKELVEYVNEVGELGNKIDIFKIEDDLYKVVVVERYQEEKIEKL